MHERSLTAPDSQRVIPVLGSSMAGTLANRVQSAKVLPKTRGMDGIVLMLVPCQHATDTHPLSPCSWETQTWQASSRSASSINDQLLPNDLPVFRHATRTPSAKQWTKRKRAALRILTGHLGFCRYKALPSRWCCRGTRSHISNQAPRVQSPLYVIPSAMFADEDNELAITFWWVRSLSCYVREAFN